MAKTFSETVHAPQRSRAETGLREAWRHPSCQLVLDWIMRRYMQSQGSSMGVFYIIVDVGKNVSGPVAAMTSMAQDLQGELQKAHPSFPLESCLLASPSPPGMPRRLQSRLVLSLLRGSGPAKHAVLPSRARAL
jgi:hypothetical protein